MENPPVLKNLFSLAILLIFSACSADFFVARKADRFHVYIVLGFCDFDNVKVHSGLCLSSYNS